MADKKAKAQGKSGTPVAGAELVARGDACAQGTVLKGADLATAAEWYRQAAAVGNAAGMGKLAALYADGAGVAQDLAVAVQWFTQAAEAGDAMSMFVLGIYYYEGHGVPKDEQRAGEWLERAAEAGHEEARRILAESEGEES